MIPDSWDELDMSEDMRLYIMDKYLYGYLEDEDLIQKMREEGTILHV